MPENPESEMLTGATDPECDYVPTSYSDYVKHLEREHPDGGKVNGKTF